MSTDEELIKEIQSGNQYAMEILVKTHYKLLFSFIYRHIGDYHTSYDITQEVLIKLVKSIKFYKDEGKFKNWLLRIAANSCNDYFRSSSFTKNKSSIELNRNFKVGNIMRSEKGIEVRIISDEKPFPKAIVEAPRLEDLYMYYFEEELTDEQAI